MVRKSSEGSPYLTVAEVAKMLSVHNMTVYRLLEAGSLPYLQVGKSKRILKSDLDMYVKLNTKNGDNW